MKTLLVVLLLFATGIVSAQPPEVFVGTDKFPQNGAYVSPAGMMVGFPNSIAIRSVNHTNSAPPFSALPALGFNQSYSYPSTPDFEISFDNGLSWNWVRSFGVMTTRVSHDADVEQTRQFSTEIQQMDIQGGGIPFGALFRESPTLASPGAMTVRTGVDGYYISSFFDVFLEVSIDGGLNWFPGGSPLRLELYYPEHHSFLTNVFPPPALYKSSPGDVISFPPALGLSLRRISLSEFSASVPLPPLGSSIDHVFAGGFRFECSFDGGVNWVKGVPSGGLNEFRLNHVADDGSDSFLDLQVLQMSFNISTYGNPYIFLVRESPTIISFGKHNVIGTAGGYLISSFFDVFLEVSTDGGTTWHPANSFLRVELTSCPTLAVTPTFLPPARSEVPYTGLLVASGGVDPYTFSLESGTLPSGLILSSDGGISGTPARSGVSVFTVEVTDANFCTSTQTCTLAVSTREYFTGAGVFPPAGKFLSPPGEVLSFPGGILVRNVVRRELSPTGMFPTPATTQSYTAGGSVDLELSLNDGGTWSVIHAPATTLSNLTNVYQDASTEFHSGDILSFDVAGGDLPGGILLRESPTLHSRGGVLARGISNGYMIDSFFDIFLEVSVNGGGSWSLASAPLHLELWLPEERYPVLESIPPLNAQYVSRASDVLIWANGIMAKDIVSKTFDNSIPPPQGSATVPFGSIVTLSLSMNGGTTWETYTAPAQNTMSVQLALSGGSIGFYDTEMLQLDIAGGDLPGVSIRESPTRPSTGRHTTRSFTPDASVQSFFDVFFEISLDGGQTWSPPDDYITLDLVKAATIQTDLLHGWNLVSVPLEVPDFRVRTLFPTAEMPWGFSFHSGSGYAIKNEFTNGPGYWLKDRTSPLVEFTGFIINSIDIPVNGGWNIIGSISFPVPVTQITSDPPAMEIGPIYEYIAFGPSGVRRYAHPVNIAPGKGYWLYAGEDGMVTLSLIPGPEEKRIKLVKNSLLTPPPPPDEASDTQPGFEVASSYPNPFNPSTVVHYTIANHGHATVKIYDLTGREVAVLVDGVVAPGTYSLQWDAGDMAGGVYFCRITTSQSTRVLKLLLVR